MTLAAALAVLTPGGSQAALSASAGGDRPDRGGTGDRAAAATSAQLGLSADEQLIPKYVVRDRDGTVHTRYDRTYQGLPVIGGDLVVHRSPRGTIRQVDWASRADLTAVGDTTPEVSKASAASVARRSTGLPSTADDARLVVYAVGDRARLAWESKASRGLSRSQVVYVNASTGNELAGWSLVHHADGTGHSLYSGTVPIQTVQSGGTFRLDDATRGDNDTHNATGTDEFFDPPSGPVFTDADNVWGNGLPSATQSAAVDAYYGAAETWDYYLTRFGRDGIADDGIGAPSYVHYGTSYQNAFWSDDCFCMAYGDGGSTFRPLVALDVAAHEMSHGVMSQTAALIYDGESGGLNEANSDIQGTMVEFFANNSSDKGDYRIGEKIVKIRPHFLRRMDSPRLDAPLYNNGDHSYNCWSSTIGNDDVHFSSGPANHWFYLLAEGSGAKTINGIPHNSPTCNGLTVNGIGRTAAVRTWYRAVDIYLTSTSEYSDARDATIRAARDLFGIGSTRCQRVAQSWSAVSVAPNDWSCSAPLREGSRAT